MSVLEPGHLVFRGWTEDTGEDPVALVGPGLDQFTRGQTPQFGGAVSGATGQEVQGWSQGQGQNWSRVKFEFMKQRSRTGTRDVVA